MIYDGKNYVLVTIVAVFIIYQTVPFRVPLDDSFFSM